MSTLEEWLASLRTNNIHQPVLKGDDLRCSSCDVEIIRALPAPNATSALKRIARHWDLHAEGPDINEVMEIGVITKPRSKVRVLVLNGASSSFESLSPPEWAAWIKRYAYWAVATETTCGKRVTTRIQNTASSYFQARLKARAFAEREARKAGVSVPDDYQQVRFLDASGYVTRLINDVEVGISSNNITTILELEDQLKALKGLIPLLEGKLRDIQDWKKQSVLP